MNKNIIILAFLGLMLAAAFLAVNSFNQVRKQKQEKQAALDSLEKINAINVTLKKQTDSIALQLAGILSSMDSTVPQTNPKWNTEKTKLIRELKTVNETYTKTNDLSAYQKAYVYEKEGFEALTKNNFELALEKISLAENTSPGFHMCYEISTLLRKKRRGFKDPATQKEIKQQIVEKLSWKAPAGPLEILKKQVKEAPVINTVKWPVKNTG